MLKRIKHQKRKLSVRARISASGSLPILSIFRSNKHIYATVRGLDGKVVVSTNTLKITGDKKVDAATKVGEEIAKLAKAKDISKVVFDRSGYKYHGRVKAIADAARNNGLEI